MDEDEGSEFVEFEDHVATVLSEAVEMKSVRLSGNHLICLNRM